MKKISFWILLAIAVFILVGGANSQTKIPGSRIQDGAIDSIHLSDDLLGMLMFEGDTSAIALSVVNGVLTLTDLNTASRDSLKRTFVKYSDSAGVALYIGTAALNDTLQIKSDIRDLIAGRGATPFIYKAKRAGESDSSLLADYATEAGIADSLRGGANQDTVNVSLVSLYALTAGSVIATDTTVGTGAVTWNSFASALKTMIKSDSVVRAMRADSLSASAFDDTLMFSAGVRSSNIPTSGQKAALAGVGTPSATNPYLDSTAASARYVRNLEGSARPIQVDLLNLPTAVPGAVVGITIDTTNGAITINDMSDTRFTFEDSSEIRSWLVTDGLAFVQRENPNGTPAALYNENGTPSSGLGYVGDWAMDTLTNALWVKTGTTTWELVSSGGSSSDSAIYIIPTVGSRIHVDSILVTSRDRTLIKKITADGTGGAIQIGDGSNANSLTVWESADLISYGQVKVDSLMANPPDDGYTGYQIIIPSTDTLVTGCTIGRNGDVNKQPYGYFRNMTVSGQLAVSSGATITAGDLMPLSDDTYRLGDNSFRYKDVGAKEVSVIGTTDSVILKESGVTLYRVPLIVTNDDITASGGTITGGTVAASSGPTMNSSGLVLNSGDYITTSSTSQISMTSGSKISVPSDISVSFGDIAQTQAYYLVDSLQKNGLITACPDPAATNPVITKKWFGEWWANQYQNIDSLYAYKWSARKYHYYKHPLCDDSLYFSGQDNVHIVWPTVPATPIEFPDTAQQIILPWITPGVPIGPYWIDSTSNGYLFSDDGAGMPEHHIQVSERFDSKFGSITGKYKTLKQAVDSLFNLRVRLDSCITSDAAGGTFRLTPKSPHVGNELRIYRGEALVKSSIRDTIPTFLKRQGVFAKFRLSGNTNGHWVEIESWPSDSTFTVKDSLLGNYFTSVVATDSVWDITLAIKTTIEVLPPVKGGHVIIDSTITINDECPIRIKGTDKNEVILSNFDGTTTKCLPMFNVKSPASYDTCYTGMPIEFSDMTIYGDTLGSSSEPIIRTAGNTKLENMNIVSTILGTSKGVIQHEYYKGQSVRGSTPFIVLENVTAALETNGVVVGIVGDSTDFQSYNSVYSVSGDSGCVLLITSEDNWPNAATHDPPSFFGDQFYFGTSTARLAGTWVNQAWDSVSVVQSHFVGVDGVSGIGASVVKGGFGGIIIGGNNSYSANLIQPPAKLKALPIKATYIPKK